MGKNRTIRWTVVTLLAAATSFASLGCNPGSFLGLQDYQRDLIGGVIGALAGALLDQALPDPAEDEQSARIIPGPIGPRGPQGPAFFSVYTSRFYGAQFDSGFKVTPLRSPVPTLQTDGGPIGFRLFIPSIYGLPRFGVAPGGPAGPGAPVTLRLYFRRSGLCEGGCFSFKIDARRLRDGDRAPQCFGGVAADCSDGTRWIVATPVCTDGNSSGDGFLVMDLPLGAAGLEFPEIAVGDYLAMELNPNSSDGGMYRLLGVELFDSAVAELRNATVFRAAEALPSECAGRVIEPPDCNANGSPDNLDIASGASGDCNGNDIPDECDISNGTSLDRNLNGKPDECEPDCNDNDVPDALDLSLGASKDCNANSTPDECDIARGTSADANANGVPDECEDCNGNGVPDSLDIANGTSRDCNKNGVPDECDIARGTSQDANGNGVPDECETIPPDCNNNGIPDAVDIANGTSRDCNTNGVPDECDIANGTSQDTNGNGIPDECEGPPPPPDCNGNGVPDATDIANGTSKDCNGNGVPDECDIANGTSQDVNGNGIPDECEDCNHNGVLDSVDIANGTSQDCNTNGKPDECDISSGASQDANSNGKPDECEDCNHNGAPDDLDVANGTSRDCNTNGKPDECDIADGTSQDANANGMPDECEDCNHNGVPDDLDIANGTSRDCNENGIPDECDIASGTSRDRNANGIPDECEPLCPSSGATRYRLRNHPDVTSAPPPYGLRLDELFNVSGNTDKFTFNFDDSRSAMWADVSATTIRIFGHAYGGRDTGSTYGDANWRGIWLIEFTYDTGVAAVAGDDDRLVDAANGANHGRIRATFGGQQQWIALEDFRGGNPFSFRFGNEDNDAGHRGYNGLSGWGWVNHGGRAHVNVSDWIFTAIGADECLPDCNANGIADVVDIADGTSEDCNSNGRPDECDLADGTSQDANDNNVPDECDPDCNENNVPDDIDIANGTSADCNGNGVPDECDIADGTSEDENGNKAPDECDPLCPGVNVTRYRLHNHPDAANAPPPYGLRLDELYNVTSGTDKFTFNFDDPRSSMWADVSDSQIRIFGVSYGGRDTGTTYGDSNWRGLWLIEFTYNVGVGYASGDDDRIVNAAEGANSGRIRATFGSQQQWIPLVDFRMGNPYSFRFGDENNDQGHRGYGGTSGWGWVNHGGLPHISSSDWLFTGEKKDDCLADCNENGVHDAIDIATGASRDDDCDGVPNECECD